MASATKPAAKKPELSVLGFESPKAWATWLSKHHAASPGLWLKLSKKGSGVPSPTYAEALDVALCWGWIDGQKKSHDDKAFLQRFTPRGKKSIWSQINCGHVERLIKAGEMQPAGLAHVAAAQADGRWAAAYGGMKTIQVPDDLAAIFKTEPTTGAFFASLSASHRYAFLWRLATAKKAETRAKRFAEYVAMLRAGKTLR
jgi:uncharacterized protein YdeI (YjbR/CyaY-like superfamily)